MADNLAHPYDRRQVVTIDDLPDDILLTVFDSCMPEGVDIVILIGCGNGVKEVIESWQSLVHVCRRWRGLVFASPRRLQMHLYLIPDKSTRKSLDVWPALPIIIRGDVSETSVDDVIAELEQSDRIFQCQLNCYTTSQIEKLLAVIQVPFPELVVLYLSYRGPNAQVQVPPDSLLGGSAPRLLYFYLRGIPFPGLPKFILSATHLDALSLANIPHSGYISPEAIVPCLSMLTGLRELVLQFESPQSCPDPETRRLPPPTRSVLPGLETFYFKGVNEYLEELVAHIDTPLLIHFEATFFNDIDFDIPELIRLVSHSSVLKAPNEAHVVFDSRTASVKLQRQASNLQHFKVEILCREPDWQLSSLAQICTTSLPLLSTTENLFIYEPVDSQLDWKDSVENIEWLELLLPFTAVKNLYLSKQFAPRIAPALQEISGSGTTEAMSTLQNLYLEGFQASESVQEGIEGFISARQLTNRPVAISVWDRDPVRDKSEEGDKPEGVDD